MLSTLAFDPSQPRDEQGQWTGGGFERVSATDAAGSGLNSEWSVAHGEADGPFWNVTGEKNARYWTIRDDSGKLVAGATTISRGLMTEVKAIGSHAQGQGQKLLDEIKAKNVWVVALAVPTAIPFFTKSGFQKTDEAPGDYNVKWRRPAVRALSFPLAPARGARLLLLASIRAGAFDPSQPRDEQGQWTRFWETGNTEKTSVVGKVPVSSVGYITPQGQIISVDFPDDAAGRRTHSGEFGTQIHVITPTENRFRLREGGKIEWVDEPSAENYFVVDDYFRGKGVEVTNHYAVPFVPLDPRKLRSASRAPNPLHAAADAYVVKLSVAFRYAFAMGRKALGKNDADAAMKAVRKALQSVLPGTLLKVVAAGGEVGVAVLQKQLKTLGGPGSGNFGHAGRPGEVGGSGQGSGEIITAEEKLIAVALGLPTKYTGSDSEKLPGQAVDNPLPRSSVLSHEQTKRLPIMVMGESKTVDIASLKSTQDYVQPSAVQNYEKGIYMKSQPIVATIHGDEVLLNGNHNVLAAKIRGETTISVQHLGDFSKHANYIKEVDEGGHHLQAFRTAKPRDKTIRMRFDVTNPAVVAWIKQHSAELIDDVSETSRKRIRLAIEELAEEGDFDLATDRIMAAVGDEDRANLIARHETMLAANEGQRQAWDQAVDEGLLPEDAQRTWIITPDEKVCPVCEPLDGTTADLRGEYADGISGPPAHVQCRCTEGITN